MYVRWNKRKRTKAEWRRKKGDYIFAIIVENSRINGKPRQKAIKYLGGIGEELLLFVHCRAWFWEKVEKKLSTLSLSTDERNRIVASIEKIVSKPSDEDIIKEREESLRRLQELDKRISGR